MADTGRTVFADGLWSDGFWAVGLWAADAPVIVPDVVGETQAQAEIDIAAVGLTTTVTTAYSSVVAAGLVISQVPAGGSSVAPGSAVAIVVSLGDAPVQDTQATGGWYPDYEHIRRQRDKRRREQEEAEEAEASLQDATDREIARLLHDQQARDADRADLQRLQGLADKWAGKVEDLPKPVSVAILNAQDARSRNSLQQMERMIEAHLLEEEMAAVTQVLLMLN